ncbi:hypothetical protein MH1LPH_03150 [Lactiplantibacillus brownii]
MLVAVLVVAVDDVVLVAALATVLVVPVVDDPADAALPLDPVLPKFTFPEVTVNVGRTKVMPPLLTCEVVAVEPV